jgi:hypothetical protein
MNDVSDEHMRITTNSIMAPIIPIMIEPAAIVCIQRVMSVVEENDNCLGRIGDEHTPTIKEQIIKHNAVISNFIGC